MGPLLVSGLLLGLVLVIAACAVAGYRTYRANLGYRSNPRRQTRM